MSSKTKGFFNKNFYFDKCIQGVLLGTVVTIIFVAIYILQLTADNNKSLIFRFVLTLFSFGPTILYFIIPWMILMLVGTSIVLLLDKRFMQKKKEDITFYKEYFAYYGVRHYCNGHYSSCLLNSSSIISDISGWY